jgi:eukaryotic-like serine/threonine-protein kinase
MISQGEQIGRYRIRSAIGKGGMGEVFLAEDTELERLVALKVLPEDLANDPERMRRFVQEAKSASALNHPNIITIHEIGKTDDTHFITTEYIEGETLHEQLKCEPMSLKSVLDVAVQVASALDAAHKAGIVHRDIKPENVMIRPDGLVKILDFGIAKLTEKRNEPVESEAATAIKVGTQDGLIIGTASYMSPEQARGKDIDSRSDIFSFGIVLYEMLTGKQPFEGESAIDTISAIIHKEPVPLNQLTSDLPRELQHIVEKTLRKDREERYQTAKDLLIDLKDLKQDLVIQNKLERTTPPNREESKTQTLNATTTDIAHTTSSAEYLARGIKQHKLISIAVLIILLLAIGGLGFWYFGNRSSNPMQIESIAVLPFVNESGNADAEYLSDGMTETLINSLSQIPKLNVKARSTVFRYKGKEIEVQTIGKELNVQAILNGRVVQRGDDLVLYLELVDAQTGNRIWGDQYNKKLANLVSLQSEIARDVSNKLKVKLSGTEEQRLTKNYTENTEAYQLYLRGRYHWNQRTPQGLQKAIEYFNQAIAVDPAYALAYAGLADSYALLPFYSDTKSEDAFPKAKVAAMKALAIDDLLVETHTTLAFVKMWFEWDWSGAERDFKRAIELNSNYPTAHQWYSIHLSLQERHQEALTEINRAYDLDPFSLSINLDIGAIYLNARQFDKAIKQFHKVLEMNPDFFQAYNFMADAYEEKGMYEEAAGALEKLIIHRGGSAERAASLRNGYKMSGARGYFQEKLNLQMGRWKQQQEGAFEIAEIHISLGEQDRALEWLEKAYEKRDSSLVNIRVSPQFDVLRSDPRFQDLLRRVGL